MKIICVNPQSDPLWQNLVEQHRSDAFHSPAWMRVLAETYGFDIGAHMLLDDAQEPLAGIPFCYLNDLKDQRCVTLPFSDYCDPLVDDPDQWQALIDRLLAEDGPVTVRCLHNDIPLADDRFVVVNKAKWHGLDLKPDLEEIWLSLHSSARRAIKKAQRAGVTVRIAQQKSDLRSFFELHLAIRKYKYRLLAQPYQFFENIWHHFIEPQRGLLMLATFQDQIIGGVLYLRWKAGLYYKFNVSAPGHLSYRPNDLLLWEGIKYAKAKELSFLDFGLSDWDQEGLVRYKRKYASEEKTISMLRHLSDQEPTNREKQLQALLPRLTNLFTDAAVPDQVTEQAGEALYRYFT